MTGKFVTATWIGVIGFVAGLSFFVWTIVTTSNLNTCIACKRPVHPETRTVADVGGLKTVLCCPMCVRMLRDQQGKDVKVTEVTDHSTGDPINPREAYVVIGSAVNYCMDDHAHLDASKQAAPRTFDRCSPSMISFLNLEAAERFQTEHGGEVIAGDLAFAFEGDN